MQDHGEHEGTSGREPAAYDVMHVVQDGASASLCRARRVRDGQIVLLELPHPPAGRDPERLRAELAIVRAIDARVALRPLELGAVAGAPVLVFEDFRGTPLATLLDAPIELDAALEIATALTAGVARIHRAGIVHRDLRPENVLIDRYAGPLRIRIFGFGTAAQMQGEHVAVAGRAEGAPPYMSPEQTGGIDRPIDARSDLYSLGVMLYEVLTGTRPFEAEHLLGWVHCHVARSPTAPAAVVPRVPGAVSQLVMRLLAKLPEDRYQTAAGVLADLRRCRREWRTTRAVAPFMLGGHDVPDRLRLRRTLYGREPELAAITRTLDRVAGRARPGIVLLRGTAGAGKTALARSVDEQVTRMRGMFAAGAYDAHAPPAPYAAIAGALNDVVPYLAAEGSEGLQAWRASLSRALGPLGPLAAKLVPALEPVLGPQPPVPELPLGEAQQRMFLVVRRLISALASRSRVLVLVLDELQWADAASLSLIDALVTQPDTGPLLVLATWCDDELGPAHPVHAFAQGVRERCRDALDLAVAPLALGQVSELCGDALSAGPKRIAPLARLVWERTGGNPQRVRLLLSELHRDGLLWFDVSERAWRWDLACIGALRGDVLERARARVAELGPAARDLLEVAACLGARFEDRTLARVTGAPRHQLRGVLDAASSAGLLISIGEAYQLLPWFRGALRDAVPPPRRAALHAQIGRTLLAHLGPSLAGPEIFEVAGQLDLGASQLVEPAERARVAALDLDAGRAASASSACAVAASYLGAGARLLGAGAWREHPELAFHLHLELARSELAQGHFDEAARLIGVLRAHARAPDRAVDRLEIDLHLSRHEPSRAMQIAIASLAAAGVELTLHPTSEDLAAAERDAWQALAGRPIEELEQLPPVRCPEVASTLELLALLLPVAYRTSHGLHCMMASRLVALSARHGVTGASGHGFAAFAKELVATGRAREARRFAEVARRVVDTHGSLCEVARTLMVIGAFVALRTGPLGVAADMMRTAYAAALAVGDLSFAGQAAALLVGMRLACGEPLEDVEREARALCHTLGSGSPGGTTVLRIERAFIASLRGRTGGPALGDPGFDEASLGDEAMLAIPTVAGWLLIRKVQVHCFRGEHAGALAEAERTGPLLWGMEGQLRLAELHFFAALAHAGLARSSPASAREVHVAALARHEAALVSWAEDCPESFLHMRALVSAERARLDGRTLDAIHRYEQAIRSAHDNGFTQGQALAYEHGAAFYADLGLQRFADLYLGEARGRYLAWGALDKVRALEPSLYVAPAVALPAPASRAPAQVDGPERLTLLRGAQILSSEIVRSKLLGTLTQLLLAHGGARRAIFLSVRGEQWNVESVAGPDGAVPESIVQHVLRARARVLLHDARLPGPYSGDAYIARRQPRSILCVPIVRHAILVGIVYLENDLVAGAFTPNRIAVLELLIDQAGISLENARLFAERDREIAERQQAEATLRSVLYNMTDAVYVCDRTARITFTNPAGLRLLGAHDCDVAWFVADVVTRLRPTHSDGRLFVVDELPQLRALAGEVVSSVDMTVRHPRTERAIHLRVSAAPLQDENGAIAGAVAVAVNVTEATELDRIKEQFVRVVAHELKTPITIVKGYADLVRQMAEMGTTPQRQLLDAMVRGADRINRLVTDLLIVWQVQTGRLELAIEPEVDLTEVVARVVRSLEPELARRISVGGARAVMVAADRELIEHAVSRLVDNALRYSPGGGVVEIDVSAGNHHADLTVTDFGIGIPEAKQAHLFEPFFRAHTDTPYDFGGLGLGLYIAKVIIQRHGGTIGVRSEEGQGSSFHFRIPRRAVRGRRAGPA